MVVLALLSSGSIVETALVDSAAIKSKITARHSNSYHENNCL